MHLSMVTSNPAASLQDFSFFEKHLWYNLPFPASHNFMQIFVSSDLGGSDLQWNWCAGGEVRLWYSSAQLMRIHYFSFFIVDVTAVSVARQVRARSLLQFSVSPSAPTAAALFTRWGAGREGGDTDLVFVSLYSTRVEEIFSISYKIFQPNL